MQSPGEKLRHLYSAIGAATNGWYNRLYTVTGQASILSSLMFYSLLRDISYLLCVMPKDAVHRVLEYEIVLSFLFPVYGGRVG